ncbi:MAG: hypothetical protein Q8P31_02690 [Bacillota bacterium]|nr:hypothetical protein [Bacillota bacterium]
MRFAGTRRARLQPAVAAALCIAAALAVFAAEWPAGPVPASRPPGVLPPRLQLPAPSEPLQGYLTLQLEGGARARLLVQGRFVAALNQGQVTVPVREGDLVEIDARASPRLIVTGAQLSEPLMLLPLRLPVEAGGRLATLGWVRGPAWPGAARGR